MAKKRMLNPSIWQDPEFGMLSDKGKILFIGCISNADDEGRLRGHSALLKAMIFPYDVNLTIEEVDKIKNEVAKKMKNFQIYSVEGEEYIQLLKWHNHQSIRPDRMTKSQFPPNPKFNFEKKHLHTSSSKNEEIKEIFQFWNQHKIIVHSKLTQKIETQIKSALKEYSVEQIKKAISNYATVLKDEKYFWTYKWILSDFLQRGLTKFLETPIENFLTKPDKKRPYWEGNPMWFDKTNQKWFVIIDGRFREYIGDEEDIEWK